MEFIYQYYTRVLKLNTENSVEDMVSELGIIMDFEAMTYHIITGSERTFTDGDIVINAAYNDEFDQQFNIYTPTGKLETRSNVYTSDDVPRTSVHTDYYNADNELIALETFESSDADFELSTNNEFGSYVKNGSVQISLKEALPLKTDVAANYDLISIVTQDKDYYDENHFGIAYYLYKKEIDGEPRADIPAYNGTDYIYDYIDTITDPVYDIILNTFTDNLYEYDGYFTYIEDLEYFDGPAISLVDSLKTTYESMYNKHWMDFKNSEPDYTLLVLSDYQKSTISSIKE